MAFQDRFQCIIIGRRQIGIQLVVLTKLEDKGQLAKATLSTIYRSLKMYVRIGLLRVLDTREYSIRQFLISGNKSLFFK